MGHGKTPLSYLDMHSSPAALSRELVPVPDESRPLGACGRDGLYGQKTQGKREVALPASPFSEVSGGASLRSISPRAMAKFSLDLYAAGLVLFDEYEMLAFQPELHPDYNATIGALTGQRAKPDKPRDFIGHWEDRLNFVRRHNPQNTVLVKQTEKLVSLLLRIERAPVPETLDAAG